MVTSSTHGAYGTPDTDRSVGSWVRRSALARSLLGLAVVLGGTLLTLAIVQTVLTTVFGPDLAAVPWWVGTTLAPLLLAGGVFGSYVCYRWLLDARLPADLSRHGAGRDLAVGLAVGAGLFTAALAVVWLAGAYEVVAVASVAVLVPALAATAFFVGIEEVVNRGILLPEVESRFGTWVALVVTSAVFAGYHVVLTTDPTPLAVANVFLAGLLLGAAYLLTRRLWLPLAVHAGWNLTQGAVFGVQVSGNAAEGASLLVGRTTGPTWLTGGAYGLEGSLVAVVVLALAVGAAVTLVRRRGDVVPRTWRR